MHSSRMWTGCSLTVCLSLLLGEGCLLLGGSPFWGVSFWGVSLAGASLARGPPWQGVPPWPGGCLLLEGVPPRQGGSPWQGEASFLGGASLFGGAPSGGSPYWGPPWGVSLAGGASFLWGLLGRHTPCEQNHTQL